jgi:birA, biotin-[acetyl-CoA-carboxylase] ligase region
MEYEIKWFEEVDSTNNEAYRQYEDAADFAVFAATFQTKGRGQRGAGWESAPGMNLTFSILMKGSGLNPSRQFLISQIVTIGVKRYLHTLGVEASIKWPNDIYVGDKKICGILIEHRIMSDTLSGSIAGIGVNINQELFLSDAPNPVSVYNITGKRLDIGGELERLTAIIHSLYRMLFEGDVESNIASLESEYHNSLYRLEEFRLYEEIPDGDTFEAKITGIDQSACLFLERRDGTRKRYHFKEVKYIL